MGFITLSDGTVIHGSQLPDLNKELKWSVYSGNFLGCQICNSNGYYRTLKGIVLCKCKNKQ